MMFDIDIMLKSALDNANLAQRQDSVTDQLKDLILIANRLKMYDVADYLKNVLIR